MFVSFEFFHESKHCNGISGWYKTSEHKTLRVSPNISALLLSQNQVKHDPDQ